MSKLAIWFKLFFILKSLWYFLSSFRSTGLSVQKKHYFQDAHHNMYLTFLVIFDLQVARTLPWKFPVNWPFVSGDEAQNRFSKWQPWQSPWITNQNHILAIFDLQVTLIYPTKFPVNWPFSSGEVQNRFSRWPPWQPSWISDQKDFSSFWFTSHYDTSYQVWSQFAFQFRRQRSFSSRDEGQNRLDLWSEQF